MKPALALALLLAGSAGAEARVLSGLDVLQEQGFAPLKGKRVGVITNHTGLDGRGRSVLRVLAAAPGVELKAFFAPEHGASGSVEDEDVASGTYALPDGRSIPLYSLYGPTKTPTAEMLQGLDALVFDIQDVGARFYTYATTMGMALEAAARSGVEFVVLDRPNPIGGRVVEGPVLEDSIRHFTAYFPVPVRHGLTMGEIARLHNARVRGRLEVVPLRGWSRGLWHDQTGLAWVRPSPNMPDVDAAALYPGVGCFEATNAAVGRGTPLPFRWVGAPWMDDKAVLRRLRRADLAGVRFSRKAFTPEKSLYKGERSRGIRIELADREAARPLRVFAHLVCALRDLHPKEFQVRWNEMARMIGTERFRELYERGAGPAELIELFDRGAAEFERSRKPFLLY